MLSQIVQRAAKQTLIALALTLAALSAHASDSAADPWEGFNRRMFSFNELLDRNVLKPVAQAYYRITPQPVVNSIGNFFYNLQTPVTIVNQLLQFKPAAAAASTSRFMFNSTGGLVGLFDIATAMGLPKIKEDFGQTLAVWGLKPGPYLMVPVLGPSTVRDFGGRVVDRTTSDPLNYINQTPSYVLTGVDAIDKRASFLDAESSIQGDRYNFIRDYYLQSRAFAIADGVVTNDEFLSDEATDDASSTDVHKTGTHAK